MRRRRRDDRLLVLLVALMGFGAEAGFAVAAGFLDHPGPVDVAGGTALGLGVVDDLVEAAGEAARARGRAAVGAGAADISELGRPPGPALVARIVGIVAQVGRDAEPLLL